MLSHVWIHARIHILNCPYANHHVLYYKMEIAQLYFIQITGQYGRASRAPPQRERHRARPGSNRQPFTRQLSVVAPNTTTDSPSLNAGNRCKLSIYRAFIYNARTLRRPRHHGGVRTRRAAMMRARTRRHTARTHARTLGKTHARTHAHTREHKHKHTTRRPRTHIATHTHDTRASTRAHTHTEARVHTWTP
jgi:hypothetical protein